MDEDVKKFIWTVASIVVGGAIIYYFFYKPKQQQAISTSNDQLLQMQIQNRILQLEYQLQQIQQPTLVKTNYKNNEKWAITRNSQGFIANIDVIRDAKVTN